MTNMEKKYGFVNTGLELSLDMLVVYTSHHSHINEEDDSSYSENPRVK